MKPTFRELRIGDYDQISEIWKQSEGIGLGEGDSREEISQFIQRNPGLSFVASIQGIIVGVILCGHDGRRGYIHHLATHPNYRQQGIGKALVKRSLKKLEACRIFKCHIFVFSSNENALEFWNKIEWHPRAELTVLSRLTR